MKKPDFFRFRDFSMQQGSSGQKINTDSCVFGHLIATDHPPERILDIGTGTGLLMLMMAKKFSTSHILGIDIEESLVTIAATNAAHSPWSHRCQAQLLSAQDAHADTLGLFDLIICNPPFFQNSLNSTDPLRATARHNITLTPHSLLQSIARILKPDGRAWTLAPATDEALWLTDALQYGLHASTAIDCRDNADTKPHLTAIEWSFADRALRRHEVIYRVKVGGQMVMSDWMKDLRREWFPMQFNSD